MRLVQTNSYVENISINKSLPVVLAFVSDVHHLPAWTRFFRTMVTKTGNNRAKFNTVIGESETEIVGSADGVVHNIQIRSDIAGRIEQAHVRLTETTQSTQVQFTLELPNDMPDEKVQNMRHGLRQELSILKHILESPDV